MAWPRTDSRELISGSRSLSRAYSTYLGLKYMA